MSLVNIFKRITTSCTTFYIQMNERIHCEKISPPSNIEDTAANSYLYKIYGDDDNEVQQFYTQYHTIDD